MPESLLASSIPYIKLDLILLYKVLGPWIPFTQLNCFDTEISRQSWQRIVILESILDESLNQTRLSDHGIPNTDHFELLILRYWLAKLVVMYSSTISVWCGAAYSSTRWRSGLVEINALI